MNQYSCSIKVGIALNVFSLGSELSSPLFVGYIIDAIIAKNRDEINRLVVIWMCITVVASIIGGIQTYIMQTLAQKIGYKLR